MVAAAAVAGITIGAFVLAGRSDTTEQIPSATTTVPDTPTSEAEPTEQIALRFVEARTAWDGGTVRSLLAGDAVIDEFSVVTADDDLAKAEFERILGWRFVEPQCTTPPAGAPSEVNCTYAIEDNMSRALGVGPFPGSSFEFVVVDGLIERVTHRYDFSEYSPRVFEVFAEWLIVNHRGDSAVLFEADATGTWIPVVTPEALALMEQRVNEFVASLDDPPAD